MGIELKPCPFCGGNAMMIHPVDFAAVECCDCHAQTPIDHSTDVAAAIWNKRTQVSPWRPIETAPRDGTYILAITGDIADERWKHHSQRCFVVRHMGFASSGYDLGWALYPGMGTGDAWLTHWMPLAAPPAPAEPLEDLTLDQLQQDVHFHGSW